MVQDATSWVSTPDGYGGHTFGSPTPIKCRWEDRTERFMSMLDRKEIVSNSIVYIDRNLKVGDYLFEGTTVGADPTVISGAQQIKRFDKTPNLRNLLLVRKAYL